MVTIAHKLTLMMRWLSIFFLFPPFSAQADPWSMSESSPVIAEQKRSEGSPSFWNNRFDNGYYFYEKVVSPADGERCAMYPTCADYAYQAVQKHGLFFGGWMATDRFMRDHGHEEKNYPLIEKFGRTRLWDPLTANDFWFSP